MSDPQEPKTMEQIQADIAALKAKQIAARQDQVGLPVGAVVELSAEACAKFSVSKNAARRARQSGCRGTVTGYDQKSGRNLVQWDAPLSYIEPIAPSYLLVVG